MPQGHIQTILMQFERLPLIPASRSQSVKFESSKHKVIVVIGESTSPRPGDGELPVEKPERDIKPDLPAYVIFTSGTTGRLFDAFFPFIFEKPGL